MGRSIVVPRASGKHALFSFAELCEANVAAADFIAICQRFHTVALDGIPVFDAANRPGAAPCEDALETKTSNQAGCTTRAKQKNTY
jgi:predicted ATPase